MDDKYCVVKNINNQNFIVINGNVIAEVSPSDYTMTHGSLSWLTQMWELVHLANEALAERKEKALAEQAAKEAKAAMEPELPEPLPEGEENKGTWWNGLFYRGEM